MQHTLSVFVMDNKIIKKDLKRLFTISAPTMAAEYACWVKHGFYEEGDVGVCGVAVLAFF